MCIRHTAVHTCGHPIRGFIPWTDACSHRMELQEAIESDLHRRLIKRSLEQLRAKCAQSTQTNETILTWPCSDCTLRKAVEDANRNTERGPAGSDDDDTETLRDTKTDVEHAHAVQLERTASAKARCAILGAALLKKLAKDGKGRGGSGR